MVTCTQEIFGYCFILKPTEASEAGRGEAGDGGGVGREVSEVRLLEAAESSNVLR